MQGKITSERSASEPVYVGIDVCKDRLDVYLHPAGLSLPVANDRDGLKRLKRELARHPAALVVMEATAKYHRLAHRQLSQAGFAVAVVNPLRARLFAEVQPMAGLSIRVDVDNLFDEVFYTNSYADVWVEPGAPRRFRLTASYSF